MDGLEQDIQYRDMKIFYNINLISYQNVIKEKDYYSFSRIEIASNLLCGDIILLDKEKAFSLSEVEILKFFIDMYDAIRNIKLGICDEIPIFSTYDNYMFNMRKRENSIELLYYNNKKKKLLYDFDLFYKQVYISRKKLIDDVKILFPDYQKIKNINLLFNNLSD